MQFDFNDTESEEFNTNIMGIVDSKVTFKSPANGFIGLAPHSYVNS